MSGGRRLTDTELGDLVRVATSGIHGKGVFASRRIRKGEYIGTFAGPRVRKDGTYVLWAYEAVDDAKPVGRRGRNLLRFLNHDARCNAAFDGFDLFALRTIRVDDEVTIDYGGDW